MLLGWTCRGFCKEAEEDTIWFHRLWIIRNVGKCVANYCVVLIIGFVLMSEEFYSMKPLNLPQIDSILTRTLEGGLDDTEMNEVETSKDL